MLCVCVQAQRHALWAVEEARVKQRARDRAMLREARKQEELQRLRDREEAKKNEEERRVRRERYLSSPPEDRVKLSPLNSRFSATLPKRRCHDQADDTHVIPWDNSPAAAFRPCTAAASHFFPSSPLRLPLRSSPEQSAQQVLEMEARMLPQGKVAMKINSTLEHHHDNTVANEISAQGKCQHEKQAKEQRPQTEETPAARGHLYLRKMEQTRAAFTSHRSKRTQLQVPNESEAPTFPQSFHSEKTDMLWKNRVKTPELPAGAL